MGGAMDLTRIPLIGGLMKRRGQEPPPLEAKDFISPDGPYPHLRDHVEQFGQRVWKSSALERARALWFKTEQSTRQVSEALRASEVLRAGKRGLREHLWLVFWFSAAINLLYLAPSLYMLQVYDRVIPTGGYATLALLTAILVVGLMVLGLLDAMRTRLMARAALRLERLAADAVMQETMRARRSGAQPSATARDLDTLRQGLTSPAAMGFLDLPWTPLFIGICFVIHFWIGMLSLAGAFLIFALALVNERATRGALTHLSRKGAVFYMAHDSDAAAAETIHALGAEQRVRQRRQLARNDYVDAHTEAAFKGAGYSSATKAVRMFLQSAALGLGAYLAIERQISPGAIIAATILTARAFAPVEQVVGGWRQVALAATAYGALRKIFEAGPEEKTRTPLPVPEGRIQLEQVAALAPDGRTLSLQQASFTAGPGEIIGVIGPSGAGKTTLARVLANAAALKQGAVRIDGARYADWDEAELAKHIGYLPQRIDLFDGTVADNISSFAPQIGADGAPVGPSIVAAAQMAQAHEMILRLPRGYETELGLSGAGISPGQAQRIALARALFGDPKVVVLDEPNSHLDADGEQALVAAIQAVRARGGVVFVIAHRAGVVKVADKLMVLQEGRIVDYGPQPTVLAKLAPMGKTQVQSIAAGAQS
jgi:ATP-binding cassette subfamily C protein